MKGKGHSAGTYSRLRRKLFGQTMLLMCLAVAGVLILRALGRGKIGNAIVDFFCQMGLTYDQSMDLYQNLIRNNFQTLLQWGIIAMMILFFAGTVVWFTRYFDQIIRGVEKLANGKAGEIRLSPELDFMEQKLRTIRRQLQEKERAARRAEERKNDLVMYLAHDMRTPLTSVIGYLSLLDENPDLSQEERERYTRIALDKAERLSGLMEELFQITRIDPRSVSLQRKPLDFVLLLHQLLEELYPLFRAKGMETRLDGPSTLGITGDPDLLARAFGNLLKNAAAYGAADTTMEIRVETGEKGIRAVFSNCCTLPEDLNVEELFVRFRRLDSSRSSATGGAGLGLTIARAILAVHGGSLRASRWEKGISFCAVLPYGS